MRAQKTVQRAKQTGLLKGCFLAISMSDPGPRPRPGPAGPSLGLSQPAGWPGGGHRDPGDFKMRRDPAQWPGGEPPGPGEPSGVRLRSRRRPPGTLARHAGHWHAALKVALSCNWHSADSASTVGPGPGRRRQLRDPALPVKT
jgi:hypothetical protein